MATAKKAKKPVSHQKSATKPRAKAIKGKPEGKDKQEKRKVGPPTKRTAELVAAILSGVANGKSARAMCIEVGINRDTWLQWLAADTELSGQYARAKEDCADYLAGEIIEIADDGSRDAVVDEDGNVKEVNHDHIARARLRVDARKWYASKLAPKKYGEKLAVGGAEDMPPVMVQKIERVIVDPSH